MVKTEEFKVLYKKMYTQVKSNHLYMSSLKMPFDDEDNFQAYQTEIYLPFTSISYFFPLLHLLIMKSICFLDIHENAALFLSKTTYWSGQTPS